ncbi:MAG: BMP family ABC transporter substrate-binding protein [Olsenella sp.]|nr:BMP family ABC transporter substrate-binding protein [Olsenella sp.]MCI1646345.1 BMP family ABC transporter substrate-binding protein [Olsenella sp.]MCI1793229.1 BMP family ABC transporter substrate-binding protein [Olsenella sp.]MCI1810272.1 BMP family ABC transporter substrate-binding protein [Olsenella sp.]MCI1879078.1 BMP family ABC transporter substrate-binding protein [Olsenella sp.]
MALALAGCASNGGGSSSSASSDDGSSDTKSIKPGFITLHDENSTYDLNFINAAKEACKELGISEDTYMIKTNIPEGQECYNAAAELADAGCNIIFADFFGHEDYMIQAAKEFPDIQFCHSTGTKAHTEGLDNYHNAFASIYEGRYLAGVAAGMKINEMIDSGKITANQAKIGYVGAYTYVEVISGYTSFFLGSRSVCPSATMEVTFTGSWYDETAEKEGATKLINDGCVLISQHADSMGAPTACENAGVPDVSYNGSTKDACPNTFIVSSRINWVPYYKYAIQAVMDGSSIDTDWTGTLSTGSVELADVNTTLPLRARRIRSMRSRASSRMVACTSLTSLPLPLTVRSLTPIRRTSTQTPTTRQTPRLSQTATSMSPSTARRHTSMLRLMASSSWIPRSNRSQSRADGLRTARRPSLYGSIIPSSDGKSQGRKATSRADETYQQVIWPGKSQ